MAGDGGTGNDNFLAASKASGMDGNARVVVLRSLSLSVESPKGAGLNGALPGAGINGSVCAAGAFEWPGTGHTLPVSLCQQILGLGIAHGQSSSASFLVLAIESAAKSPVQKVVFFVTRDDCQCRESREAAEESFLGTGEAEQRCISLGDTRAFLTEAKVHGAKSVWLGSEAGRSLVSLFLA